MKRLSAALVSLLVLARCAPVDVLNATISRAGLDIRRGISFGPEPFAKLDVYRPKGSAVLPVIVFIYGGSWRSGSRGMYPFVAASLARQGNVVMVPDYRLYPQVRYPDFLTDNARAVAWALAHTGDYGGNPARVFLMGHSAGAYNAAMLATDPDFLAASGAAPGQLAGMIGLAGPYDFLPITDPDVIPVFATAPNDPASMPINHVSAKVPPMLLLAGDADMVVKPRNSRALGAKIQQAGGRAEVKIYPGVAHIGIVLALAPLFRDRAPVLADVLAFMKSQPDAASGPHH